MSTLKTETLDGPSEISPDLRKDTLLAAAGSVMFHRSARLREFLLFVGTRALEGREREITEHQIGVHVFHKDERFNPAEDNIVRASARMLRVKLREYFESEGALQPWRIEIPKGSYVPVFSPAPAREHKLVAVRAPRWMWLALGLLALTSAALLVGVLRQTSASAPSRAPQSLWTLLMRDKADLNIVGSDSLHAQYQSQEGRLTPFQAYASGEALPLEPPAGSSDLTVRLWNLITRQTWSHAEDLRVAFRLALHMPVHGKVDLLHPRQLRIQSFRRGENFLIVGGVRANPWAGLFESELNFQMVFPTAVASAEFHNRRPLKGEQDKYSSDTGGSGVKSYGRIAILPGLADRGTVVLIAGITTPATEAAGELLLSPNALDELQQRLGRTLRGSPPRKLEVLLETSSVGGATKEFHIVAVR